ncbi:hypothetical protein R82526_03136 [Ralstonia mannitolilytica]|uniref:DUF2894 domain-containing protein n=1 Tax=Ralstonia mannitolilytica TaxID=105219 RepID=UPI0007AFE56A|nr:DUF2894 domain-containing protein [Ralstonia mannitolilytica]ANA36211.1 hypothetical protein VZ52_18825 [Ralstonia mannitolilytica]CAJ0688340.1 hypothetical protein R82526_03136 [Ralstonia mannitolilytica]CAJ0794780.1 hypothetical protein LMG18090_03183 [Ralstonia mannitolilytica]CAJ0863441.1 hypothetical protein R76727_01725 [Ralstonia mannitolilytica]
MRNTEHLVGPNAMQLQRIEALRRRAAGQTGEVRRLLDERVAELQAACPVDAEPAQPAPPSGAGPGPLAALLGDIEHHRGGRSSHPPLDMLEEVRALWSRLSAEKQVRESLDKVPANAGPLNSLSLVHRSLSLMRTVSPEYLRQFLGYIDALSWLEQMGGDTAAAPADAGRTPGARKGARSKSR